MIRRFLRHARPAWILLAFCAGHAQVQAPVQPSLSIPPPPDAAGLGIVQAVQITLNQNPLLRIQEQQVNFNRGALFIASSIFDTTIGATSNQTRTYIPLTRSQKKSATDSGIDTSTQDNNSTNTNLNANKLFRSGISIAPSLQLTRGTDNLTNQTGLNNSTAAVQVTLPLLRNRGRAAVAAQEISAGLEVGASSYDLSQLASSLIAGTASSYWNYVGAVQSLAVYQESEARGQVLVDNVRALVAGDIIPRVEVDNAVANLAARSASRIGAEQNVVLSKQALAIAMGFTPDQVIDVPPPIDPYPDGAAQTPIPTAPQQLSGYIRFAFTRRGDLLAAKQRVQEAEALNVSARNQLRPELNAVINFGYSGLQEATRFDKYLSTVFQNVHGPNVTGGLVYSFPLENRFARGQVLESDANVQQGNFRVADLGRNIASNVVNAATGLDSAILQLKQASDASAAFRIALEGQRDKLRLGVGSILDVLQTEDRLINAMLTEIAAKNAFATAIANFRLATGTYLLPNQPVQSVPREDFYAPFVP